MKTLTKTLCAVLALSAFSGAVLAQTPATAPASQPSPVVATINGKPIDREDFVKVLMAIDGRRVLFEFWAYVVVMEAVEASGATIGPKEIDEAKNLIIKSVAGDKPVDPKDVDAVVWRVLQQQGVASPLQADWAIKRLAGLHMLAKRSNAAMLTDEEFKNAREVVMGEKAAVLIIQCKDVADANKVILDINKQNMTPQDLAPKGYPVERAIVAREDKNLLPEFKQAVFTGGLKEKAAANGAIKNKSNNNWLVVYLEKKEEAKTNPTETELKQLRANLQDQKENMWRQNHLNKLIAMSKFDLVDPILRQQEKEIEALRQQAQRAATQPASLPAPATAPAK